MLASRSTAYQWERRTCRRADAPPRQPIRAWEQRDGRVALLSAGLMPAAARRGAVVCEESEQSSLRCQAWWVKINPFSLLTANPALKFVVCELWSYEFGKDDDSGAKPEPPLQHCENMKKSKQIINK